MASAGGGGPAAHEADYAQSLFNLAVDQSTADRVDEALVVARQAVEIRRRLAAADPAAHEPLLARG